MPMLPERTHRAYRDQSGNAGNARSAVPGLVVARDGISLSRRQQTIGLAYVLRALQQHAGPCPAALAPEHDGA